MSRGAPPGSHPVIPCTAMSATAASVPWAFGRPLEQRPAPLCPEIVLWLLDPEIDLEAACRELDACHPPPYWAFCWGAGQALARYLLDSPEVVRGRDVVDFGSGCGIAAIAAARGGARRVLAVDNDPEARAAVQRNAAANDVAVEASDRVPPRPDLLLCADVLYEPSNFAWLREIRPHARDVIVADPERAATPDLGQAPVRRYTVRTEPDVDSPMQSAAIFLL